MRIFLIIVLCFFCNPKSDMILWTSHTQITWSDFQGVPPNEKGLKLAVSSVKIVVEGVEYYEGETPNYVVMSYFNKKRSWSVTTSEKSLLHERLHFDITEIYSRKIRRTIKNLKDEGEKDENVYKEAYRKLLKDHGEAQDRYDKEVYFNKVKQQEWVDNFHKELEELKDYEYIPVE